MRGISRALKVFSNIKLTFDQVHVVNGGAIQSAGMWSGIVQTPNGVVPATVNLRLLDRKIVIRSGVDSDVRKWRSLREVTKDSQ